MPHKVLHGPRALVGKEVDVNVALGGEDDGRLGDLGHGGRLVILPRVGAHLRQKVIDNRLLVEDVPPKRRIVKVKRLSLGEEKEPIRSRDKVSDTWLSEDHTSRLDWTHLFFL